MGQENDLRDLLDNTAQQLAHLEENPRMWHTWLIYLLGNLEKEATGVNPSYSQIFREMLASLQDSIRDRLNRGGW